VYTDSTAIWVSIESAYLYADGAAYMFSIGATIGYPFGIPVCETFSDAKFPTNISANLYSDGISIWATHAAAYFAAHW
jgi:hypothetical protein